MNQYFIDNRLQNNKKKTKVMLITQNKEIKKEYITLDKKQIKHQEQLKVLGTIFNENLNWNDQIRGKKGMLYQLKQRATLKKSRHIINPALAPSTI